ncbi:thioredoxin H2-like [Senna tora]|uniref:Thioredoxin H2-like n=1 Tax=Senna tora TaxID=362788 RepID=A0A834SWJ8_9FABA|nr:thioredoxin H2-like [Senna tora]
MGGKLSNLKHDDHIHSSSSSHSSQILSFHSSAKWKAHFDASNYTNKLMVIEFTATWCGPAKYMDPIISEFAAKYSEVEFIKIDVDELMDVSKEFKVEAMPTFIFIKKGEVVDTVLGARKEDLKNQIEKHIK